MRVTTLELEDIHKILKKEPEQAVEDLLKNIEELYGEVPYILRSMEDKPELLITKLLYDSCVMREFERLDQKTIELISIGVSAALRCSHCLSMHIRVAKKMGISKDEILDAILIAGTLSNASVLAYGNRALDAEMADKKNATQECNDDVCDLCEIPGENLNY
jgi:AhpD family alkylhydroperoxidase